MAKPLYVATSLSQLNEKSDVSKIKPVKNPTKVCQTASKVYLQAKEAEIKGDEEMAYVFLMRFLGVVQAIQEHPQYKQKRTEFDKIISVKNMTEAMDKAEKLADSLSQRYTSGDVTKDDIPVKVDKKKPAVKEQNSDLTDKPFITVVELYNMLQKQPEEVLVLDCRPKSEWDSCHTDTRKFPQWLSIPEEAVNKGLTVHLIPRILMAKAKKIWEERNKRTCVIVDFASSASVVGSIASTLKDVVYKYDTTQRGNGEPKILDGGFQRWHLSYGPLCVGTLKVPVAVSKNKAMSSNVSESFQYPAIPEVESTKQSQKDNADVNHSISTPGPNGPHSESCADDKTATSMEVVPESIPLKDDLDEDIGTGMSRPTGPESYPTPKDSLLVNGIAKDQMLNPAFHPPLQVPPASDPYRMSDVLAVQGAVNPALQPQQPTLTYSVGQVPPPPVVSWPYIPPGPSPHLTTEFPPGPSPHLTTGFPPGPQVQRSADMILSNNPVSVLQSEPSGTMLGMPTTGMPFHPPVSQQYVQPVEATINQLPELAPEFDHLDHQVQYGVEQKNETTGEIEEVKRQMQQLKQLMEQRKLEEQRRQQIKIDLEKQKEEQSKVFALEDRLAMLERQNAAFRDQQNQLVLQTMWAVNEALQGKSQGPTQQQAIVTGEQMVSGNQEDVLQPQITSQQPTTLAVSQEVSADESVESSENTVHTVQNQEQEVKSDLRQQELDTAVQEKMKELEEKLKILRQKEEMMEQQESRALELKEREAAMAEKEVLWERKKAAEEMSLQEQRANLEEEKRLFREKQEEVMRQQAEYKKKQENLFSMMELMNKSQPTAAPQVQVSGGNLPPGWEKRLDHRTGRFYYIDHSSKTTHWNPPTNWLRYGQGAQPPSAHAGQQLPQQISMPTVPGGTPLLPIAQTTPSVPSTTSRDKTPEKSVVSNPPSVDRSKKPTSVAVEPQVNRALKPEVVKQRMQNLQPVMGSWIQGSRGLTGLRNLGNTCFMNSTLQCLINTTPLMRYCTNDHYKTDLNRFNPYNQSGNVAEEFSWLMKAVWSGNYKSVSPRDFRSTIVKCANRFHGTEQQDSQELLAFLLDGLHEDLNKAQQANYKPSGDEKGRNDLENARLQWISHKRANDSIIVDLFQGQFRSTVKCLTCQYKSVVFEAFMYLPVPIPAKNTSCTLRDCINAFTKRERMSGDNKWDCPHCKCKREVEKVIEIWKLPPILIVIMKRFWWDSNWTKHKITNYVDFPVDTLDMSPHVVGPPPSHTYSLYATSNHTGRLDGGHYVAYCKNITTGRFHCFDDEQVKDVAGSGIKNSSAYFLFYTSLDFKHVRK